MVTSFARLVLAWLVVACLAFTSNAQMGQQSYADLAEELLPSVVNISSSQTVELGPNPFSFFFHGLPDGEDSPFKDMPELFDRFGGEQGSKKQTRKTTSLGSGFVISEDGYIVTNHHVIEKAEEISVILSDETKLEAEVVGSDPKTDIALLKIETTKTLKAISWGDSEKSRVGDWVIAIGNPFGLGGSVSAGIISARARDINAGPFDDFIQTDAAINRGNSGGPLFDMDGKVIGVNTAIFSPSGGNVGIGFASPAELVMPVVAQLKEHGRTYRGWLGVKIQTVSEDIAESLGLEKAEGALVLEVTKDSPAGDAGFKAGDVIVRFDNKAVPTMKKLPRIVAETEVGKHVPVVVWRNEKEVKLDVVIAELDEGEDYAESKGGAPKKLDDKAVLKQSQELLGMHIAKLNKSLKREFKIEGDVKGAVIVKIDDESQAFERGLRKGDVIQSVNQKPVDDAKGVVELIEKAKSQDRKSVLFLTSRAGEVKFVALNLE